MALNISLYKVLCIFSGMMIIFSCVRERPSGLRTTFPRSVSRPEPRLLNLSSPSFLEKVTAGQNFMFSLTWVDSTFLIDSTELFFDTLPATVLGEGELRTEINTGNVFPGTRRLRAVVHFNSGKRETHSAELQVLSDIIPQPYTYRVRNNYPHDIRAFTQGFEYHNNFFYEGTGQYGESSLRKTEISTGQILKARTLPADIFGEGITILNNRIYQITYRSQVGFVYDLETLEQIQKIYYQNKEGWGLTNNGSEIIMSDGTNQLYFMDPQYFSVIRKIEVMDHNGKVDALNELEWIKGKIWANRYLTDELVIIDPESGRVEGLVNLSGLLKPEDKHQQIDVLNGIAWDEENKRLFVTGKYWPKVFEIEIIKF